MKFHSRRKVFGTVTVNDKGQIVIPADARKELGIEPETKLVVFGCGGGRKALMLLNAELFEKKMQGFWGSFFGGEATEKETQRD